MTYFNDTTKAIKAKVATKNGKKTYVLTVPKHFWMIITGAQMDVTRKKKHNRRFHIHKAHSIFQMRRKTLALPKTQKPQRIKFEK